MIEKKKQTNKEEKKEIEKAMKFLCVESLFLLVWESLSVLNIFIWLHLLSSIMIVGQIIIKEHYHYTNRYKRT